MQIIQGNLLSEVGKADLLIYTANNQCDKHGHHVMGGGIAKAFKERFPLLPAAMGHRLKDCTNYFGVVTVPWQYPEDFFFRIGALQTKYHWRDPSPIELVARSLEKLALHANQFDRIAMPMPGTGLGGLSEADVMPLLERLPSNVFVYQLP